MFLELLFSPVFTSKVSGCPSGKVEWETVLPKFLEVKQLNQVGFFLSKHSIFDSHSPLFLSHCC